jgi:S-adenosylmethionine:tRNA ribosyltransferase-isomerase
MNNIFDLSNYDYKIPQELIAQEPLNQRDHSRLLVMERKTGKISHDFFYNIGKYFNSGDCLILNNTKVIPARLFGRTEKTGAAVEILILDKKEGRIWDVMMKNSRRVKPGEKVMFPEDIELKIIEKHGKTVEAEFNMDERNLKKILWKSGVIPLPPYIKKGALRQEHRQRYQTVYAEHEGAKAAPTAGLHFTEKLLEEIKNNGVKTAYVTLHVGLGTFEEISQGDIRKHVMHTEEYRVDENNAGLINESKGRIIAAGTTSLRVIEAAYKAGKIPAKTDSTDIYIYPGYKFIRTNALITNFHLPRTTLLALVSAFAGIDNIKNAYQTAIIEKYRFFSYGDAMLII